MPPKSGAAPKEETELWSQHEGEVRPPAKEAASPSPGPAAKAVAEEEEGAGTPGWEVGKPGAPTGLSPARALPRSPRTLRGRGEGSVWGGWGTCKTTGPKCLRSPGGARSRMGWRGSGHGVSGEWVRTLPPLTSPVCGRWHLSRPTTVPRLSSQENTKVRKEIAVYASGKTADPAPLARDPAELSGRPLSGLWPWVGEGREEAQVARRPILPECLGCLLLPSWSAGA